MQILKWNGNHVLFSRSKKIMNIYFFCFQGAHLPTPPPIPPEIQKALEYLKTLPPSPEDQAASNVQPQYRPRGRF